MHPDDVREEDAFAEIVGGFKVNTRSRAWLVRWAAEGPLGGTLRDYFKDDLLAGGTLADLLGSTAGWWNDGGNDPARDSSDGWDGRRDGARWTGRGGAHEGGAVVAGRAGERAALDGSNVVGAADPTGGAPGGGAVDRPPGRLGDGHGSACCCHRWARPLRLAASAAFAGSPIPDRAGVDAGRGWRGRDLQAEILSRAAYARAVLATGTGSKGRGERGWRGALAGSAPVAVLVGVGEQGRGSSWIVRGQSWSFGPRRVCCLSFASAVRIRSGGPAGSLLGGRPSDRAPLLSCGLCGGALGARDPGLDSEIAAHPLSPSWVTRDGA